MPADLALLQEVLKKKVASEPLREALSKMVADPTFKGVVSNEKAIELKELGKLPGDEMLLVLAEVAQVYAMPSISDYHVGAVVQGADTQNFYMGANIEFMGEALSFTVHAEQAATVNAWQSDKEQGLKLIAINEAPCGYCRQFLNELTSAETLLVMLEGIRPEPLKALLPRDFGPEALKVKQSEGLMSPQEHNLSLPGGNEDPVVAAALAAANKSYAPLPYIEPPTACYAGVAVATASQTFAGRLGANVAYNPSISPLEAAMTMWTFGAAAGEDVERVVLVQAKTTATDQTAATEAVAKALPSQPPVETYLAEVP